MDVNGRHNMKSLSENLSVVKLIKEGDSSSETLFDQLAMLRLAQGLKSLEDTQKLVSGMVSSALPPEGEVPSRDQIRTYFLATVVELVELMNELNWKPWKQSEKDIDVVKVADEFADILAFLGVILNYLHSCGVNTDTLAAQYARKSKVNIDRFNHRVEGY